MVKWLEYMMTMFTRITTGVVFVTAVFIQIFYGNQVDIGVEILWQDLIVSAVCTLCTAIIPVNAKKEVTKYSMLIRMVLCYVCVNIVVLVSGSYFEWFSFREWKQVLGMVVTIVAVFIFVALVSYRSERREAERMNEKLRERN